MPRRARSRAISLCRSQTCFLEVQLSLFTSFGLDSVAGSMSLTSRLTCDPKYHQVARPAVCGVPEAWSPGPEEAPQGEDT
jgi:hypothetical protein